MRSEFKILKRCYAVSAGNRSDVSKDRSAFKFGVKQSNFSCTIIVRNVGNSSLVDTVKHSKNFKNSETSPRETKTPQIKKFIISSQANYFVPE